MNPETFADALIDGLVASDVALVAGVPDGLFAPAIARLHAIERPRYVACAREEECVGVAAGAAFAGRRAVVLCQNAGLLNSLGAFATLALRYRLPLLFIIANRGGPGDANSYDVEKHVMFSVVASGLGELRASTLANFDSAMIADAYAWAEAAERPIVLSIEKGVA